MSESEFVLALDMGMSRVGAATARLAPSEEIEADSHVLGHGDGTIAAACYVTDEGDLLFGRAAEDAGAARPERLIRGFVRDVGDEVPLLAGGRSVSAEELCARLVLWAREEVARGGPPPAAIALTHPSSWTAYRAAAVRTALSAVGVDDVELLSSAEAVTRLHDGEHRIEAGETIAVYDLGGSTFEATVLQKGADGTFVVRGTPVVLADHGGMLFDDAVLAHALSASGADAAAAAADPAESSSPAALRRAAEAAKQALSFDGEATMSVDLPGGDTTVRITRSEFEAAIEPALDRTLDALERAIDGAGRSIGRIDLILLAGGSTRIPLVAQRLSDRFDRPLAAAPDMAAAIGAARTAAARVRESIAAAVPSTAPAAPSAAARPGGGRLLAALRPMIAGSSARTTAAVTIAAATVVVAAGFAATAFGAGIGETPTAESAGGAGGSVSSVGVASAAVGALLDRPIRTTEQVVEGPTPDDGTEPPGTDPGQHSDGAEPPARRTVREPLGDAAESSPTTRSSAPSPLVPAPSTGTAPGTASPGSTGQTPSDTPADETPPDDPPPAEEPPVEQSPAEQPPAEQPPADPPVEDPPPAEQPVEQIPTETDPGAVIPAGARLAETPTSDL